MKKIKKIMASTLTLPLALTVCPINCQAMNEHPVMYRFFGDPDHAYILFQNMYFYIEDILSCKNINEDAAALLEIIKRDLIEILEKSNNINEVTVLIKLIELEDKVMAIHDSLRSLGETVCKPVNYNKSGLFHEYKEGDPRRNSEYPRMVYGSSWNSLEYFRYLTSEEIQNLENRELNNEERKNHCLLQDISKKSLLEVLEWIHGRLHFICGRYLDDENLRFSQATFEFAQKNLFEFSNTISELVSYCQEIGITKSADHLDSLRNKVNDLRQFFPNYTTTYGPELNGKSPLGNDVHFLKKILEIKKLLQTNSYVTNGLMEDILKTKFSLLDSIFDQNGNVLSNVKSEDVQIAIATFIKEISDLSLYHHYDRKCLMPNIVDKNIANLACDFLNVIDDKLNQAKKHPIHRVFGFGRNIEKVTFSLKDTLELFKSYDEDYFPYPEGYFPNFEGKPSIYSMASSLSDEYFDSKGNFLGVEKTKYTEPIKVLRENLETFKRSCPIIFKKIGLQVVLDGTNRYLERIHQIESDPNRQKIDPTLMDYETERAFLELILYFADIAQ